MHLTRPKSSKGRSRPAADTVQEPSVSPNPPSSRTSGNLQTELWRDRHEVLQMLHRVPAPPQFANKYKVLPPIERRRSAAKPERGLDESMSKLNLSDKAILQQRRRHGEPNASISEEADVILAVRPRPPAPRSPSIKEFKDGSSAGAHDGLLLAIRTPCGRRFQQHFQPTDTLLAVRTSAESRHGTHYGDVSIETMDVPRRTFTDMEMTLAQCGILNRSLLCISPCD